ncbi:hypothetical protein L0U85_00460 [Glycomyces sp. L485]|nr:hypothetical protein [Glycomyces sp. L485]
MFDPGLVYESGPTDWIEYICGTSESAKIPSTCENFDPIEPSQLNYPSISVADLTGVATVTRTVTNVDDKAGFYKAKIDAPDGTTVKVDKRYLYIKPGESATYTLTIERTDGAFGEWAFGDFTWKEYGTWGWDRNEVRSPIVVKPSQLGVDAEIALSGASGESTLSGTSGFDGTLGASVSGLVPSEESTVTLTDPDSSTFPSDAPVESPHAASFEFATSEDAALVRFSTFGDDHPAGTDLDLFVYEKADDGSLALVGSSATGTSDETVTLPGGRTFVVFVDLWAGAASVDTTLHAWIVPSSGEGNLTASPAEQGVSLGGAFEVDLAWSGFEADARYLGTVDFNAEGEHIDSTVVNLTT